jgi:hypothetical protein
MKHDNHSVVQKKKYSPVQAAADNTGKYGVAITDNRNAAAIQLMRSVPANDNKGLEKEADNSGAKAMQTVQRYGPDPQERLFNVAQRKETSEYASAGIVQRSGRGGGGGGGGKKGNNKKQEKQKAAAKSKAQRAQSQADRNAFRAVQYETTSKKDASAKQEAAKKIKGNLAHGFGDSGSGKQGKTKEKLKEINKEIKEQKEKEKKERQEKADKAKKQWDDRSDRDDQGGAGFGHGVLVEAS